MTPAASSNWSIGSRSASTTMRAGPRRVSWGSSFGPSRRNRSAAALADSPWGTWLLTGRSIPIASGESVMRRVPQDTEAAGVPDDSYALPRSDALIQVKANGSTCVSCWDVAFQDRLWGRVPMEHDFFDEWLAEIGRLTAEQRSQGFRAL